MTITAELKDLYNRETYPIIVKKNSWGTDTKNIVIKSEPELKSSYLKEPKRVKEEKEPQVDKIKKRPI